MIAVLLSCGSPDAYPIGQEPIKPLVGQTAVALFTSPDGQTWTRQDNLTEQLVSLGMWQQEDGALWVTGLDMSGKRSWWERLVQGHSVRGLIYEDGTWTETRWSVRGSDAAEFIDPQWHEGALWYIDRTGEHGDPVSPQSVNTVASSPPLTRWFTDAGIADPNPVRFNGALHVFLTQHPARILHLAGDPLVEVGHWGGYSVPSALVVGDELWVLAQGNIRGRRQPMLRKSRDGKRWGEWTPVIPWDAIRHCTSPVMAPVPEGWVLLCVEE